MIRAGRAVLLVSLLASAAPVMSQPAPRDTVLPDRALFRTSDLWVLAGFAGATVAMFPLDRAIAGALRDSGLVASQAVERAASTIGFLGSPGPFIIGGAMYVVGRYGGKPRVAHLAVHGIESIIVGLSVVGVLKTTLGRARPFVSADTNPGDFGFLRGFRSDRYQAFPSGHATTAFAAAAAVTAEAWDWWPRSRWVVGPLLYGGATLVGLSRMYEDKHWASDIIVGAAIGTFAGLKTVRFTHTRTGNRVDRWLLGDDALQLSVRPSTDGTVLVGARARW